MDDKGGLAEENRQLITDISEEKKKLQNERTAHLYTRRVLETEEEVGTLNPKP